jgi:flagellar biosynthesis protein
MADSTSSQRRAAALAYNAKTDAAPRMVAVGEGFLAEKIIELAKQNGVEIVENPALANAFVKLDPGQEIPRELYRAVAEVIAFVYRLKKS